MTSIIKKSGINKPIMCKGCGKRVGFIKLKWRFKVKLIAIGFLLALLLEIPAQLIANAISKHLLG